MRYGAPWIAGALVYGGTDLGVLGAVMRANTASGPNGPGILFNDWDAGDDGKRFRALIVSGAPAGAFFNEDGSFSVPAGTADGMYSVVYRLYVDGADLGTTTVGIAIGSGLSTATATGAITLSTLGFTANASALATAHAALTLTPITFTAVSAALVGATSLVTLHNFDFSSAALVQGESIQTFDAYATASLFVSKFGLAETTQYLADEQRLLTEQLLQDAISGSWSGAPSAVEQAAARAAIARLNRQLATSSRLMDGYLRTVVALPLPAGNENASTLEDCCLALARGGLADDCDNYTEQIERSCEQWTKWLKDIAARRVQLVQPSGEAVPTSRGVRAGQARSAFDWGRP